MREFNPADWYWRKSAEGDLFSSKAGAVVPATDTAFLAWSEDGTQPTVWPSDDSGKQTDTALKAVLNSYGIWLDTDVAVPIYTYKVDLFRRATENEAEQIDAALSAASARMRRLFDGAQRIDHDAEEFLVLQAATIDLFGQARADVLLAPSN